MATARHRASNVLEIARDRHVEQALNETPEKLESRSSPGVVERSGDHGAFTLPCLEFT